MEHYLYLISNAEFLTNTFHFSFEKDVDIKQMNDSESSGSWTHITGSIHETNDYLFINYARKLIGLAYVNKRDNSIHNLGYFLYDDFNDIGLPPSIEFVEEGYIYMAIEPYILLKNKNLYDNEKASPDIKKLLADINEDSNPIIIKIKLK